MKPRKIAVLSEARATYGGDRMTYGIAQRGADGKAELEMIGVASRLSTLETLGSYRMSLTGDAANPGISNLSLTTQQGALQLTGSGTAGPAGVRFRGEARATVTEEAALSNLLNIIGRRDGARSVISIG